MQRYIMKIIHQDQAGFMAGTQVWFNTCKLIIIIFHIVFKKDSHLNRHRKGSSPSSTCLYDGSPEDNRKRSNLSQNKTNQRAV